MPLALIGISHRNSPVALREPLTYSAGDLRTALETFGARASDGLAGAEFAILSTCNRTELYLARTVSHPGENGSSPWEPWEDLTQFLSRTRGVARELFAPYLYRLRGLEALQHLCGVAAGLDSMVLGEAEILGQVADAREAAAEVGTLGPVLTAAFQCALRAGRRARAETGICRHAASVGSEAVSLLAHEVGGLDGQPILLLGTGRIAARSGQALRARGATNLSVVSRSPEHAAHLAAQLGARAVPWSELEAAARASVAALCATAAPHAVLTTSMVRQALAGRGGNRPLVLVDLAVPRDVEPEVRSLPGVRLFDLDDLQSRLFGNLEARRSARAEVEAIVREEIDAFEEWHRGAALRPLLTALRRRADQIRRQELERMLRDNPDLPDDLRQRLEYLTHALVNKLMHEPTARLRAESDPLRRHAYAEAARHLFGIEAGSPDRDAEPLPCRAGRG